MKFLIDNNLSYKLVDSLEKLSIEAEHVKNVLSVHATDIELWHHAYENGMLILTKDNDFNELSQLLGCPPKIIHLICGNKNTEFITNLLSSKQVEIKDFVENDTENCLLKIG